MLSECRLIKESMIDNAVIENVQRIEQMIFI